MSNKAPYEIGEKLHVPSTLTLEQFEDLVANAKSIILGLKKFRYAESKRKLVEIRTNLASLESEVEKLEKELNK